MERTSLHVRVNDSVQQQAYDPILKSTGVLRTAVAMYMYTIDTAFFPIENKCRQTEKHVQADRKGPSRGRISAVGPAWGKAVARPPPSHAGCSLLGGKCKPSPRRLAPAHCSANSMQQDLVCQMMM